MNWLDWVLIGSILLTVLAVAIYTNRYMRSVADFLSGGRLAGRYLLAVAKGEQSAGAVVFVAMFEMIRQSGFTLTWWGWATVPVGLIVIIFGFVTYRYRETRAMTLAQFFEIRYSRSFRIFTGFLGFFAGIVNFGIIPAVGSRFLVYFLELPPIFHIGSTEIQTYIPLMAIMLIITLIIVLSGGMITLMITNCLEGMISQILYVVLVIGLISMFSWEQIEFGLTHVVTNGQVVERASGHSLVNPFDSLALKDFNIWYVIMSTIIGVYGTMAWQNQSAYNSAASSAHESRMGGILGRWKESAKGPIVVLLGVCAMTFLIHPDFAGASTEAHQQISNITDSKTQSQMQIPIAVVDMLPNGLKGALCVILLMGVFGGDGAHLHSWGSLLIQDVLVPFRKKVITPDQHIRLLRYSMIGVAIFAFLFGALFPLKEYISMWWAVTQAIFTGGAGAVIIGGLYWKKGTTAGAWTAMITGSVLTTGGILLRLVYGNLIPLNPMEISFSSAIIAVVLYVVVSLLTCKEEFNMDRMLHRNQYRIEDEATATIEKSSQKSLWVRILGIDENFTRGDTWITGVLTGWTFLWFFVFIGGSLWNWASPWSTEAWSKFWYIVAIAIPTFLAVVGTVWFTWGGIKDMKEFFRRLKAEKVNTLDNGMVANHHNLGEPK